MVTYHKRPHKEDRGEFNNSILSLSVPHIAREFEPSEHLCGDNLELGGWLRRLLDHSSDGFLTWMLEGPVRVNAEPDPCSHTWGHPW